MKIAVTYENGQVYQHFGHTEQFKVYDVENGAVQSAAVIGTNGSGHSALAGMLKGLGVDTLICGGIGGGRAPCAGRGGHPPVRRGHGGGRQRGGTPAQWQPDLRPERAVHASRRAPRF